MSKELFKSELPPIRTDAAVEKLRNEMESNKNNPYIQVVGEFLTEHLELNPQDGEKILSADKTIVKSLDAMRKEAEKQKVGNMAMFTPKEGFEIVLKYFGIESAPVAWVMGVDLGKGPDRTVITPPPAPPEPKPSTDFSVNLEDLLGG